MAPSAHDVSAHRLVRELPPRFLVPDPPHLRGANAAFDPNILWRRPLSTRNVTPHISLREQIQEWVKKNAHLMTPQATPQVQGPTSPSSRSQKLFPATGLVGQPSCGPHSRVPAGYGCTGRHSPRPELRLLATLMERRRCRLCRGKRDAHTVRDRPSPPPRQTSAARPILSRGTRRDVRRRPPLPTNEYALVPPIVSVPRHSPKLLPRGPRV